MLGPSSSERTPLLAEGGSVSSARVTRYTLATRATKSPLFFPLAEIVADTVNDVRSPFRPALGASIYQNTSKVVKAFVR